MGERTVIERTFVAIKPDGVQRGLIGEVIKRFEQRGMKIIGMKMLWVEEEFAGKHYEEHKEKKFFKNLVAGITEGPIVGIVIEGVSAIKAIRNMVGSTEPASAAPGTIRGDFAHVTYDHADKKGIVVKNIIHASANEADAEKEIRLWFKPEELHTYSHTAEKHSL